MATEGSCFHAKGTEPICQGAQERLTERLRERHRRQRLDTSFSSQGPPEAQLKLSLCHGACVWFSPGPFCLGSLLSRVPSTLGSLTALPPTSSSPAQSQSRQTGWNRRPKCSLGAHQTSRGVLPSSPRDMGEGGAGLRFPSGMDAQDRVGEMKRGIFYRTL